jgi:PEP-CTERM/exosortase A-associated glycosyltransferase
MKHNIRVLHILNHSYPYADGYAIRSFSIVNAQRLRGLKPVVLTSPKHEPAFSENPEYIEGTAYYRIHPRNSALLPANIGVISQLFRRIFEVQRQQPFDLVHAHSPSLCGLAAMIYSCVRRIPFLYEVRAFWEDAAVDAKKYASGSIKYRMERTLETLVLRRANAITTIASYLKNDVEKRRGKQGNVFLIPNGVDSERFQPTLPDEKLQLELGIAPTDPVIGFIGSFYRFEGLDILLQALAILKAQGLSYKAILTGGGEMEAEWRQLANNLGLTDVHFTGRIPHTDVLRYYSIMNLCVYPRLKEQITDLVTPLKPLEAMAMGILVVGSNVGGICELLESRKGGLLFPAGNAEALAQLLRNILADPLRYRDVITSGRDIVQQTYSWKSHAERYHQIYQTLLS